MRPGCCLSGFAIFFFASIRRHTRLTCDWSSDVCFSDRVVAPDVVPLDVGGDYAAAEWCVAMTHTGPLVLADGVELEPTGLRVTLHGVTVAEFEDDRI